MHLSLEVQKVRHAFLLKGNILTLLHVNYWIHLKGKNWITSVVDDGQITFD